MISITSTELNYLVFRYLHESGFTHAAFTLGYEAGINKSIIEGNLVPPGALLTFVQKGIQYLELEIKVKRSNTDIDEDISLLQSLDLITKDVNELQISIQEKKEDLRKARDREKDKEENETEQIHGQEHTSEREWEHAWEMEKEHEREHREKEKVKQQREAEREKIEKKKRRQKGKRKENPYEVRPDTRHDEDMIGAGQEVNRTVGGLEAFQIPSSNVMVLKGHTNEVPVCAWSKSGLLATGSRDFTARIWSTKEGPCSSVLESRLWDFTVLNHEKDVTALNWNGDGTLLATGSYDGQARIWKRNGELNLTLTRHMQPIVSLKWNNKGDYLLSGSVDKTAIVWDVKTGDCKQHFWFHLDSTLDVDWRNNDSFATCSADCLIYVYKVGKEKPIKTFMGHQREIEIGRAKNGHEVSENRTELEINAIRWDAMGKLLASCSEDSTAKIWSMKQKTCVHDLKGHSREVYSIRWSPTGPGTNNPNQQSILASASFDSTVKLWDVGSGSLLHSLNGHSDLVDAVAFSPNGEYLASGARDKNLHIWSVKEAKIVKTYAGSGSIYNICWNKEGDKIGACFSGNTVCILDFRM